MNTPGINSTLICMLAPLLYLLSPFFRPLFYISICLQGGYTIYRGVSLGRVPLIGVHDTLTFLAFSTAISAIFFFSSVKRKKAFFLMTAIFAALLSASASLSKPMNFPLPAILKTVWFELHVILAFASYGLFGVGSILGITALIFPEERGAEPLQYRAIVIGYFIFSLSMIFGGVWAFLAWANYWVWTPKELWTSLVWVYLTLYLHLRYRSWWKNGKGIIVVGIANYIVILFTYLGVSLLMKSSHSF